MKLFYSPMTRAAMTRWALEECGAPHQLVRLKFPDDLRNPEVLALNPLGQVPILVLENGQVMTEASAICLELADRYGLAPPLPQRGDYYQWCFYMVGSLEPPLVQWFLHTIRLPEAQRDPEQAAQGRQAVEKGLTRLQNHLRGRTFLVGDQFTMADVILGATLDWIFHVQLLGDFAELLEYYQRLTQRPAYQRSHAD